MFARKVLPKRTQFGPLEGNFVSLDVVKVEDDILQLFVENELGHLGRLDISDESKCSACSCR